MDCSESDTSDEELGMQKKALDVRLPDNFDPNSEPQTGEEYLQHVIYERTKKCKRWVTAQGDFTKFRKNQTVHVSKQTEVEKALDKFYPTIEWQDKALKDFTQLRNFIKNTEEKSDPKVRNNENFITIIEKSPPKFSQITQRSQAAKINMLEEISKYLNSFDSKSGISENVGTWIYAILALLQKPLSPDCCHKLREFAKICAKIRASFDDSVDEKIAVPFNLYICVIARYFNQLDLLMDPDISHS